MHWRALCFTLIALAASPALCEDAPQPAQPAPDVFVSAYGDKDPACLAWTDSCQLCLRGTEGKIACSTPGIACIAGPIVCTRKKPE